LHDARHKESEPVTNQSPDLGKAFAHALARKEAAAVAALLDTEIDFRALTPNRAWKASGSFVVEQQAYYTERDGQITWMRVLCSGFRHAEPETAPLRRLTPRDS
jgi:hypothetical protein